LPSIYLNTSKKNGQKNEVRQSLSEQSFFDWFENGSNRVTLVRRLERGERRGERRRMKKEHRTIQHTT